MCVSVKAKEKKEWKTYIYIERGLVLPRLLCLNEMVQSQMYGRTRSYVELCFYLSVCAHGKLYGACPEQGGKVAARLRHLGGLLVVTDTQRATFQWTGGGYSDISRAQCPYRTQHSHNYIWRGQGHVHTDSHAHFTLMCKTFRERILAMCVCYVTIFFIFLCLSYCVCFLKWIHLFCSLWADTVQHRVRLVPYTWQHPAHTLCECCK